jgi:hypothetical protein
MEQIEAIVKGIMGLIILIVAGIVLCSCTTSSDDSHTYSAPTSFTVSNDAVVKVARDAIAGDSHASKMAGSPVVRCLAETECGISYTVQETAGGLGGSTAVDQQLIEPTRQIWKTLFTDLNFQAGKITVSGPVTAIGGKSETVKYYELTCDRNAASQIDWDKVDGNGLRTLCIYSPKIKGMPGMA